MYNQAESTCQAHGKEIMGVEDSAKNGLIREVMNLINASKYFALFRIKYCVSQYKNMLLY